MLVQKYNVVNGGQYFDNPEQIKKKEDTFKEKIVSLNEELNTIIQEIVEKEQNTKETLEDLLQQLKEIDLRGSFESDDEVGAVFTQIKNLIKQYNDSI